MSTSNGFPIPVADLKAQASEAVRKAGDTLAEQAHLMRETVLGFRYDTQDYIESNPWQSVAIAAGVGLGVGFLFGIIVARR